MASQAQTQLESRGSGAGSSGIRTELSAEVLENLAHLKSCICAMGGLLIFRLLCEIYYIGGAFIELIIICVGVNVLVADPLLQRQFPIVAKIPDLKKTPPLDKLGLTHGLQALIPFIVACGVGALSELRHTLYMKSANATNLEILVPILVYANTLVYVIGIILALKLQCGNFTTHSGNNYATTAVANANVGHPDSLSDDDDMRRAMEESRLSYERRQATEQSQRQAMQGLSGAERRQAVGISPPAVASSTTSGAVSSRQPEPAVEPAVQPAVEPTLDNNADNDETLSEEEKNRRSQQASMKAQMEEARLRRQNEYRANTSS